MPLAARPAHSPSHAASQAGFTLIEALVVIALMATAFAMFAGVLVGSLPGQQLRNATGLIAAEMRAARARAVATGIDQGFVIDTATREWRSGPLADAAVLPAQEAAGSGRVGGRRSGRLDAALEIGATVAREEQPGPGIAAIRFFADGSSSGGRIVVRRGDAAWRVDVHWLTGTVRVERGEGR